MPILSGSGWRKFISQDATIRQTTNSLRSQAENNVDECRLNPPLKRELFSRCAAAIQGARRGINGGLGALPGGVRNQGRLVAPWEYREEPTDEWRTFGLMAETFPGQSIIADCDCLSPAWAAFFELRWNPRDNAESQGRVRTGVGISQPKTRPCRCKPRECKGRICTPEGPICESCGYGMAHAYTVLRMADLCPDARDTLGPLLVPMDGRYRGISVADGSVWAGMGKPRPDFYGSGETALKWLREEPDEEWDEAA
jgi:hypothetical protein